MRIFASHCVLSALVLSIGCGDEASAVRGAWNVSRLTIGFAPNLECNDLVDAQTNDAGTMSFDDVPHPDGIGAHTFTYSLTQVPDGAGAIVAADPPFAGSAGWEPDDGKEDTAGFTVDDPDNASMSGLWNILESAIGAVNMEHFVVEDLRNRDGGARCTRSEYFLVAP